MNTPFQRFRPDDGRTLDMTPDGAFVSPPPGSGFPGRNTPWANRVLRAAVLVVVLGGVLLVAALALWLALVMIPVMLAAAAIAYCAYRWRMWQLTRSR